MNLMIKVFFIILSIIMEYISIFYVIYHVKIRENSNGRKIVVLGVGCALIGTLVACHFQWNVELTGFVVALFALYGTYSVKFFKCFQYYLVSFLMISLFTSACEFLLEMIGHRYIRYATLFHVIAILFCWIYYILFGKYNDKETFSLAGGIGIWLIVQCLVITLMVTNYQYLIRYQVEDEITKAAGTILAGIGGIMIAFSYFVLLFFVNQKRRNQDKIRTIELQGEIERNYFKRLLQAEDETRKFRHDYIASMVVLKEYLKSNNTEMAEEYLCQLETALKNKTSHKYTVGDELADAILNYYLPSDDSVKITIRGAILTHGQIVENDLTILLSNLVRNAIEEVSSQKNQKRFIQMECFQNKQILRFTISNSYESESDHIKDGAKKKSVLKGHVEHQGIGLGKVDETVKKYGGSFYHIAKGDIFEAGFTIPIKE